MHVVQRAGAITLPALGSSLNSRCPQLLLSRLDLGPPCWKGGEHLNPEPLSTLTAAPWPRAILEGSSPQATPPP